MLSTFLSHQWKDFWRSRNKAGSIAAQILLGFFMLYFLVAAIGLGFGMSYLIQEFFPSKNVIVIFNGFILYYFLFDLGIRTQMQELPTLSIIPYLHLNISKKTIVNFLNIKSLFSFFNLLPLFIFIPFSIIKIGTTYGAITGIMYIVSILSLTVFNNYLVLYLKRKSINNIAYFGLIIGFVAVFAGLDYYNIVSVRAASNFIFMTVVKYPFLGLAFTLAAGIIFFINSIYLRTNLYTEELSTKDDKKVSTDYAFLNRYGKVGELAALELKLILRHKRSRGSIFMGFAFLAYGFIFYKAPMIAKDEFGKMLFAALFMTGITIISYGQFMFAWQSTHFDGLLVNKIDFKNFIKAKFLLFTISCTIITLLASFYGFMSYKLLLMHLAAYLYNIGFATVIVLYFATMNYKRLDLTKGASFNWQGVGATQWILGLPFILVPVFIYLPFGILNKPYWGLAAIAIFGLITLLMRNFWINLLVKRFEKQRYKIAEGFRE
ncbi:hypothetical protein EZ428_01440 [Pedobacter frigiditerrae]|uniref:ABC-2 type transport system permease protein n=1 Tax=Pedobacter frigiditerrae TaxID=2530452 RepID=A0A4R0N191_9SPHI|nr:DUF5687 family protein [Pedobacter frigiditerrae]TCC93460.1 hypothetical protein EZ428_01440 [Pedobacter frigiditerrae]